MKRSRNLRRDRLNLRHRGIEVGTDIETGKQTFLDPALLYKGVHALGPPGSGKTKMLLNFFSLTCRLPHTSIILLNPKGKFAKAARDTAIAAGQSHRLVLFDPNDPEFVCGYNPLKPNSLEVGTHAKMVREGIRASWGQSSFDQTPQLARFLYLGLYIAREREMTLVEAVQILRPQSSLRQSVMPSIQDPFIKETLMYLDSLRPERQEDLVASCLARLEAFSLDPLLRTMMVQRERTLNVSEILNENKILLCDIPFYNPLRPDDAKLLLRLILNDVLASVFGRPENKRQRVILICDEVHTYANEDLCTALELGRELNLCTLLAHQHMGQLLGEDGNTRLADAVKNCCRTRLVFGGNWKQDLDELVEDLWIDQYDPWAIKDEITSLELNPIESLRKTYTHGDSIAKGTSETYGEGENESRGKSLSRTNTSTKGEAQTNGTSEGESEGESVGESEEESHGSSIQRGQTRSREQGESVTHSRTRTRGEAYGLSHSVNHSRTSGRSVSDTVSNSEMTGESSGSSFVSASGTSTDADGNVTSSNSSAAGSTDASVSASTYGDAHTDGWSESETEGTSDAYSIQSNRSTAKGRAFAKSRSRGEAESLALGISFSTSKGKNKSRNHGRNWERNQSHARNWSEAASHGESRSHEQGSSKNWTEGTNETKTKNASVTEGPFYEYRKSRPVTTRTYLSEQEQMTQALKKIKEQRVGRFVLKVQGNKARFMRAPFVPDPQLPKKRHEAAREKIFALPYYTRRSELEHSPTLSPTMEEADYDPNILAGNPRAFKPSTKSNARKRTKSPQIDLAKAIKKSEDKAP